MTQTGTEHALNINRKAFWWCDLTSVLDIPKGFSRPQEQKKIESRCWKGPYSLNDPTCIFHHHRNDTQRPRYFKEKSTRKSRAFLHNNNNQLDVYMLKKIRWLIATKLRLTKRKSNQMCASSSRRIWETYSKYKIVPAQMKIYILWWKKGRFTSRAYKMTAMRWMCHMSQLAWTHWKNASPPHVKHTFIDIPGKILTRFVWLILLFKSIILAIIYIK